MSMKYLFCILPIFFCAEIPLPAQIEKSFELKQAADSSSKKPQKGPPGPKGDQGPPGESGKQGEKGDPGPEYNVYGSYYTVEQQKINSNEKIIFDKTFFEPEGIVHHKGNFVIKERGLYEISYGVSQSENDATIALQLNNIPIPGSYIHLKQKQDLKFATLIVPIETGQILNLMNATPDGPICKKEGTFCHNYFRLSAVDPNATTAFITIRKIHEIKDSK